MASPELELKPTAPPQEACTCPPGPGHTHGASPKKHSIDMGSNPVKQHQLEWHVARYMVGSGKGKKNILNSVGAWVDGRADRFR